MTAICRDLSSDIIGCWDPQHGSRFHTLTTNVSKASKSDQDLEDIYVKNLTKSIGIDGVHEAHKKYKMCEPIRDDEINQAIRNGARKETLRTIKGQEIRGEAFAYQVSPGRFKILVSLDGLPDTTEIYRIKTILKYMKLRGKHIAFSEHDGSKPEYAANINKSRKYAKNNRKPDSVSSVSSSQVGAKDSIPLGYQVAANRVGGLVKVASNHINTRKVKPVYYDIKAN